MQEYKVEGHVSSFLPEGHIWKLIWADEFDGTELDRSKWDYRLSMMGKRHITWTDDGVTLDGNSNAVFRIYEKDGWFCYEINDEYYRMVYHVKYADGSLEGFYTQHGKETAVKYEKIDDVPEDAPYKFVAPEVFVPNSDKTRIEILKEYPEYDRNKEYGCSNEFVLGGDAPKILQKYNYNDYIDGLDTKTI